MSEVNFIQKIEDLDEVLLHGFDNELFKYENVDIYGYFGKTSKKLYGLKIMFSDGTKRDIWFSDIDRINQIIKRMVGE